MLAKFSSDYDGVNSSLLRAYSTLCAFFAIILVSGNLIYQKFITLHIFHYYRFEISAGAILYPLTFFITDIITEIYGNRAARFCIRLALSINLFVALVLIIINNLPAADWSRVDDQTFDKVFGMYGASFAGSIIACYFSQLADIFIYSFIKTLLKDKLLLLRSSLSSCISLLFDTIIVISILTLFKVLPSAQWLNLVINSYSYKFGSTILISPLFLIVVQYLKKYKV